jgi:hypothetical protein
MEISYRRRGVAERAMRLFARRFAVDADFDINGAGPAKPTYGSGGGVNGPKEDVEDRDEGLKGGGGEWTVFTAENLTCRPGMPSL